MIVDDNVDQGTSQIRIREVEKGDLPIFFEQQLDPSANYMAAFTREDPADRGLFDQHWSKIITDELILIKTILYTGQVAGSVLSYEQSGEREVSYWLGREFWGKGIATKALSLYLDAVPQRPIYARAARDNIGSIRVLEKCGFIRISVDKGFANSRGEEIEEVIMILE